METIDELINKLSVNERLMEEKADEIELRKTELVMIISERKSLLARLSDARDAKRQEDQT